MNKSLLSLFGLAILLVTACSSPEPEVIVDEIEEITQLDDYILVEHHFYLKNDLLEIPSIDEVREILENGYVDEPKWEEIEVSVDSEGVFTLITPLHHELEDLDFTDSMGSLAANYYIRTSDEYPFDFYEDQYGYHGTAIVVGYPEVLETPQAFCFHEEGNVCDVFEYMMFHIQESDSPALLEGFMGINVGNAFVGEASIGLGCIIDSSLSFFNHSANFGAIQVELKEETTQEILAATEVDPITLKITRYYPPGGSGAPTCYSHFSEVSIVE